MSKTYQEILDGLDELVVDYGEGPELVGGPAEILYRVKRGKHYNEAQARVIIKGVARDLYRTAYYLEKLVDEEDCYRGDDVHPVERALLKGEE